jgi:hypothetical protein
MPPFISGIKLSELFFKEAVQPILHSHFPRLRYAAARLGYGSEVLGFDDEMSRDHDWGPRLTLFVPHDDLGYYKSAIDTRLRKNLPYEFHGYPTNWTLPHEDGTWALEDCQTGQVNHRVEINSIRKFVLDYLGFDIEDELQYADWLTFPQQKLLGITAGAVFHDDIELKAVREYFSWYPEDVWLYLMASVWQRLGQESHLMGRAGEAGSELGSTIIATRLVRDIMRLGFLVEKHYAPYAKWFGQAFNRLDLAGELYPLLSKVLEARTWQARDERLAKAYKGIAGKFDSLGVIPPVNDQVAPFYSRPFYVVWGEKIAKDILAMISDPGMREIASLSPIGGIDLISDNTDLLAGAEFRKSLRQLFK